MKFKSLSFVAAAVASVIFTSGASAQTSFASCVSTKLVQFDGSIVDAAIATPELSTLVDAVVAAGLAETLATAENITVYAPTNDAFAVLPSGLLDTVVGSPELLTAVLTYHVSPNLYDPRQFFSAVQRPTLQGQKVFYSRGKGSTQLVNNANVACQGIRTDNGLVWVIDSVLLPAI